MALAPMFAELRIRIQKVSVLKRLDDSLCFDVSQYLVARRLGGAAELLLETTLSVKGICKAVGMNDQNLFSRLFRKRFGTTPSRYRSRRTVERVEGRRGDNR